MTLHTRLTFTLAAGVAVVITGFQAVQSFKVREHFEKAGQANAQIVKETLSDNAENVQRAVEFGISTAMASGDMDIFDKVAKLQKNLRGLREFSLYNQNGRVTYSSDPLRLKTEMEAALKEQLFTRPERLVRESPTQIDIYQPRVVEKSCIECHKDWKVDMVAGVTLFRYSKEALAQAADQSLVVTREAGRSSLVLAAVTIGGTLVVVTLLVTLLIRPVTRRLEWMAQSLDIGTQRMNESSSQLAFTAQSIAEGASEQAASLEETSSSLEEISSMTRSNSESAQKADRLAKEARGAAEKGAADMKELAGAIEEIKVSSDGISKIIKAIDEIAFQTNILALNAAVEAARAGESGLGFAVVADEVRSLAQRSAQAAKETSGKIEAAISKNNRGVELSARVGKTLEEIVGTVREVGALVSEVAGASSEQSQGITQVNVAVAEMDKVTQRNAANAEESASASQELTGLAKTLQELGIGLRDLVSGRKTTLDARAQAVKPIYPEAPVEQEQPLNGSASTYRLTRIRGRSENLVLTR